MAEKDELSKCLKNLGVEENATEEFVTHLMEVYKQLLEKDIRASHPSFLKMRHIIETMLTTFSCGYKKVLTSSTYSSSGVCANVFNDLNDALAIQIEKAKQFLTRE